jgi:ubiquitin-protein ligase
MALHGRRARLLVEFEKLINLEKRSEFIKIEPVNKIEGMPPEDYLITFTCRGISRLNPDNTPQYAEFHQVSMKLTSNFPNQEPYLKWLTPIWHPNIEHKEPHHVCTNNVQNWYSKKSLDDLVITLGEMIQYRHYHAAWVAPFPLDKEAADWVVNFAEPNGFIGQDKPIDDRQILRPQKIRPHGAANSVYEPPRSTGRLKLGAKKITEPGFIPKPTIPVDRPTTQEMESSAANAGNSQGTAAAEPMRRPGITLGLRAKEVRCIRCYENFTIQNAPPSTSLDFLCVQCQGYGKFPH